MIELNKFEIPGKVILTGEHSVIYGSRILSMSINNFKLSIRIEKSEFTNEDKENHFYIKLKGDYKDDNNEQFIEKEIFSLKKDELLQKYYFSLEIWRKFLKYDSCQRLKETFNIISLLKEGMECNENNNGIFHMNQVLFISLFYFHIYLFSFDSHSNDLDLKYISSIYDIISNDSNSYIITINSSIPIGAGLGSSAAFSIGVSNVIYEILYKNLDILPKNTELSMNEIISLSSYIGETFLHYKTTGADVGICLNKGLILFTNFLVHDKLEDSHYETFSKYIEIYLISTKIIRSAYDLVKKVSNTMKKEDLEEMKDVSERIISSFLLISQCKEEDNNDEVINFLSLINKNQILLNKIGVSNKCIDDIVDCLYVKDDVSCKITGAGGGGHLLAFVRYDYKHNFEMKCIDKKINYEKVVISKR